MILDWFFWKYEKGVKLSPTPPQKKLPPKSPALLGLKVVIKNCGHLLITKVAVYNYFTGQAHSERVKRFLAVNCFRKTLYLRCLMGF